jgi:hypothetical protein
MAESWNQSLSDSASRARPVTLVWAAWGRFKTPLALDPFMARTWIYWFGIRALAEPSGVDQGVFATQGILGGDRAPFLWFAGTNSILIDLHKQTDADVGVFANGLDVTQIATSLRNLEAQPMAEQYKKCDADIQSVCGRQYNGTCWIDRTGHSFGTPLQDVHPRRHNRKNRVVVPVGIQVTTCINYKDVSWHLLSRMHCTKH